VAVEPLVLSLVDGLLKDEVPDDGLANDDRESADRLLSDGPVDPPPSGVTPASAPVPAPAPAAGADEALPPEPPVVSPGCASRMGSSAGNESADASLTEVIEARQRM
jgi:hypothetical protein